MLTLLLADAAASPLSGFLENFLTPGGVASALGVVLSLVGGIAWFNQRRKRILASVFHRAFQAVEDIAESDEVEDGFDKTARYLKEVDARLLALGWRPATPEEQVLAKQVATELHGSEIAKAKVAAAAVEAAGSPS
jgi:hypothetical protein